MALRVFLFKAQFAETTGVADIRVDADSDEAASAQVDAFFAEWDDYAKDWRTHLSYITTPVGDNPDSDA